VGKSPTTSFPNKIDFFFPYLLIQKKIIMEHSIEHKLLPYQIGHTLKLNNALDSHNVIVDASDTGTGKTYCAMALCAHRGMDAFIICPKSVINNWFQVAKIFGVNVHVSNYEKIKGGKCYTPEYHVIQSPYFKPLFRFDKNLLKNIIFGFDVSVPDNCIVLFDEAHKCKNKTSENSKLLSGLYGTNTKCMLLSATLTDKISTFDIFGMVLGLYEDETTCDKWIKQYKIINKVVLREKYKDVVKNNKPMASFIISLEIIHSTLFPEYGSRLKISELGDLFPNNTIHCDCYYMDNYKELDEVYKELNYCMNLIKMKEYNSYCILARLIRARQRIEILKIPIFVDIIRDSFENQKSVVVFVNYIETLDQLCYIFKTTCVIRGGQTIIERNLQIDRFQNNKSNIIICMISSGSVGISLHDIHGGFPRESIISPTWSGWELKQILGRVHRAGGITPSVQKIVYCANSYEQKICDIIKIKLSTISGINDGDMFGNEMDVLEHNKTELNVNNKYCVSTPDEYDTIENSLVPHDTKISTDLLADK
jgi:superfamily II DNA or RNA helicase